MVVQCASGECKKRLVTKPVDTRKIVFSASSFTDLLRRVVHVLNGDVGAVHAELFDVLHGRRKTTGRRRLHGRDRWWRALPLEARVVQTAAGRGDGRRRRPGDAAALHRLVGRDGRRVRDGPILQCARNSDDVRMIQLQKSSYSSMCVDK